jgi:HPt (histidine-containing phosphotransfer) domain-containing protein
LGNNDTTSDSSSTKGKFPIREFPPKWSHLVSEYLRDLPSQIKSIRAILETADYAKIKKQAHRIKGTAGTYGLEAISKSAAQLELSAEIADPDRIITAINDITSAIAIETIRQNTKYTAPAKPISPAVSREKTGHERTANA